MQYRDPVRRRTLSFHASSSGGGFEFFSSAVAGGYISGRVVCYTGAGNIAVFVGQVTKPTNLNTTYASFYIQDNGRKGRGDVFAFAQVSSDSCPKIAPQGPVRTVNSGDISIR